MAVAFAPGLFPGTEITPVHAAQDPIQSDGEWLKQKTVNGTVFLDREGAKTRFDAGLGDEPLAGVKVYAQWIDYNNRRQKAAVSPIYTTQTKADGRYTIHLPDWTDALGTVHKWQAGAGQKLRIWADNPDPENIQVAFIEGDSVFGGGGQRYLGSWNSTAGINLAEGYNISYHEREQDWLFLPEDQETSKQPLTSTGTATPPGQATGFVFYDQRGPFGDTAATPRLNKNHGDVAIPGVKVRASYVQDEVARRFDKWKNDHKGYTHNEFRDAQKQIMAEYEAETGNSAIAETAVAETDGQGYYRIQFKGLYGNSYKSRGTVPEDKWGTLAGSSTEGTFLNIGSNAKHVNLEYMYTAPILPDGLDASMDTSQNAMFQDQLNSVDYVSGSHIEDYVINLDFALRHTSQGFDILEYNSTDNPAKPGDTAKTETFGLIPNQAHVIVWTDSDGNEVHRCEENSDNVGTIPSCDFTVPADLAKDTLYTASVYNANDMSTVLMADSFFAYVAPKYEDSQVKAGEEATVARPKNENGSDVPDSVQFAAATADDVKNAPEFQKGSLPADAAPQDWVTVNADGTLTLKPGADVKPGTYNVPVKLTYDDGTTKVINAKIVVSSDDATTYEPDYNNASGAPGTDVKIDAPTFTDADGKETQAPEGTTFGPGENVPDGVTIDENTGEITVAVPEGANPGDTITVPVEVTYPDGSKDTVDVTVTVTEPDATNADVYQPAYEDASVAQGQTATVDAPQDENGQALPEGTKFAQTDTTPNWVEVAEDGTLTLKPTADVAPGDYEIPVSVTYPDGSSETINAKVTVTEPQADTHEPAYKDGSGKPGEDVKIDAPTFTDKDGNDTKAPEGTTFKPGKDAPEGTKVDENTGAITFPVPEDAKPGDKISIPVEVTYPDGSKDTVDVTVTVEATDADNFEPAYEGVGAKPGEEATSKEPTFTDKDGNDTKAPEGTKFAPGVGGPAGTQVDPDTGVVKFPVPADAKPGDEIKVPVTVAYPDGSTDTVDVVITVTASDADNFEPAYEGVEAKPGEEATSKEPTFTDKDGNDTKAPEGTAFKPGEGAPEGTKVDENTGVVTFPVPEGANPGDEITVPVEVTYPDGSKETVDVVITVGEPDAKQNDEFEPAYEGVEAKPGEEATSKEPTFTDKDGNDTKAPEGTTFKPGEGAPEGTKVDENTGVVTFPVPEGANPGDTITVPVEVTYPDGTKDTVELEVTVGTPDETPEEKPDWKDNSGKPGDKVEIPNEGGPVTEGTTVETEGPGKAVIDENGKITVDIDKDAKPGDEITVIVKDKDGNEIDKITVTVDAADADNFEPKYEEGYGAPGTDAPVNAPTFTDADGKEVTLPEGTKFEAGSGATAKDDGSLVVPVPEDAKPGSTITVPVTVTYPDGSKDTVDVTINVTDPAEKPDWKDNSGKPGETVTVPNEGGEVPEGTTVDTTGPGKATIDENGNIVVDIDKDAKPGQEIEVVVKDKDGNEIDKITVTVEEEPAPAETDADTHEPAYKDGSGKPGEDVKIDAPTFTDKDGNDAKAPEGTTFKPGADAPEGTKVDENTGAITFPVPEDAKPGDKISIPVEVTYPDGSKDTVDVTVTVEKPAEKPDWKDDSGKPGDKVEIPNEGGPVPDGTEVETDGPGKATIDDDGKITVDIDKDAKPGDKITVIVKDKDGNEIDKIVVEVEKPADKPAEKPDWKDETGKPGDSLVIPNEGGPVPDGSTVDVDGPGKATIDEDGNIRVDIDKDAKPGDKITVTVKDKDGNVLDQFTVTVGEDANAGSGDNSGSDDQGTAGDTGDDSSAGDAGAADSGDSGSDSSPLPRTGVEIAGALAAAAGLLAAGVLMVVRSRRKNN